MTCPLSQDVPHYSVMLPEVVSAVGPKDGGVYVDGTLGAGGYTEALLKAADCVVVAVDRDRDALALARERLASFGDRVIYVHDVFSNVCEFLKQTPYERVDGVVLDLGVSSMQLDRAERGFSFRFDGPLDMRMDQNSDGETAADLVNSYDEQDIANILYEYGEERKSRRVAAAIVARRADKSFSTTQDLADVIRAAVGRGKNDKVDPATRSFQALRIAVNRELGELEDTLQASLRVLNPGGRLVVVTFHSLEDRAVKEFMREQSGQVSRPSRHVPEVTGDDVPCYMDLPQRKAVKPSKDEVAVNARSRSAKLRLAVRNDVPLDAGGAV